MFADSSDESEGDDAPAAAPAAPAEDNEKKRPLEEEAAAGAALPPRWTPWAPRRRRSEHALHEKLKADTQRRLKKRRKEEREERKAQPAYERQSMHGQKIAISVGPCSLPENMRTTAPSIRARTRSGNNATGRGFFFFPGVGNEHATRRQTDATGVSNHAPDDAKGVMSRRFDALSALIVAPAEAEAERSVRRYVGHEDDAAILAAQAEAMAVATAAAAPAAPCAATEASAAALRQKALGLEAQLRDAGAALAHERERGKAARAPRRSERRGAASRRAAPALPRTPPQNPPQPVDACADVLEGSRGFRGMRYWARDPEPRVSPYADYGPSAKYVTFEPDNGGWNNIRMAFETVAVFAHATGRTLVMPPAQRLYLLKVQHEGNRRAHHGVDAFLNFDALGKVLRVVDTPTFLREAAGLFDLSRETNAATASVDALAATARRAGDDGDTRARRDLREGERRAATSTPRWAPMREAVLFGSCAAPDPPWRTLDAATFATEKRRLRPLDAKAAGAAWVHFEANASFGYRVFTHWYTFFLFDDGPTDAYYKRFARDATRYRDDILQYVSVRISADEWNATPRVVAPREVLFVLTDEADRAWFAPIERRFRVFYLADFEHLLADLDDPNARGMVEQLVASAPNCRTFTGTFFSTFSSYVARLRAYYGHAETTFFYAAPPVKKRVLHEAVAPHYPFFNRVVAAGHGQARARRARPGRGSPTTRHFGLAARGRRLSDGQGQGGPGAAAREGKGR
ncbi:GDP-fucose protein O-fucosyltransferase [Aureococcus anophagefferens]|nr:GDP-fucose protein O-fucosyltransferase [Aureococcus anophagefferens]